MKNLRQSFSDLDAEGRSVVFAYAMIGLGVAVIVGGLIAQ